MENNGSSLAKVSLGINVLLVIAVIVLFIKMPSSASDETSETVDTSGIENVIIPDDGKMSIAFFNSDSLNVNLLFMQEMQGELEKLQLNAEAKMRNKESEIKAWQDKWAKKGQLLPSEQEQYYKEAAEKEQDLAYTQQNVQMELAVKQEEYLFSAVQRISEASKAIAIERGLDYVLSYQLGQNLYYASPNHDITDDLIQYLNDDYNATSSNGIGAEDAVEGEN